MAPKRSGLLAGFVIACLTAAAGAASAQQQEPPPDDYAELGPVFLISLGGKLYDDLWTVTELAPPDGANPAYPANPDVEARDTWRCVSCHGWDYRGREGERAAAVPGPLGRR